MVLLAVRMDARGVRHFLIQNSWRSKPFFEVDEAYLHGCDALLFFIETPQTGFRAGMIASSTGCRWVDADCGESSDQGAEENA